MKKLVTILTVMTVLFLKGQTPKYGSEDDSIRHLLFACQPMKELLQRVKADGRPGPFQTMAEASKLADEGKKDEAISKLRGILALPGMETRVQLWVWTALRDLGEKPDPQSATEVLGVVVEVPVEGAYDTLAAYQDGSARYLNFSGKAFLWDKPDPGIKKLCQALLDSAVPLSSRAKLRTSVALPKSGVQATLLTRSGMWVVSDPPDDVVSAGGALMSALVHHLKEK